MTSLWEYGNKGVDFYGRLQIKENVDGLNDE